MCREVDPSDNRAVRVALTTHGRRLAERFYLATCRRIERLSVGMTSAERATLANLLGRIVNDNDVPVVFADADESIDVSG